MIYALKSLVLYYSQWSLPLPLLFVKLSSFLIGCFDKRYCSLTYIIYGCLPGTILPSRPIRSSCGNTWIACYRSGTICPNPGIAVGSVAVADCADWYWLVSRLTFQLAVRGDVVVRKTLSRWISNEVGDIDVCLFFSVCSFLSELSSLSWVYVSNLKIDIDRHWN